MADATSHKPLRVLVVCPSWVGDAVMATPALRRLRAGLPGAFIGGLVRPGIDEVLAGLDVFDEVHVERAAGMMGPKRAAAKVRPRRYEAAVLLTNSFSTALITRLAGIPRRIGYARDGRGLLLTEKLEAPKRAAGGWAPIPAVSYYWHAAGALLGQASGVPAASVPAGARLELAVTPDQSRAGAEILARVNVAEGTPVAILNPGGNRAEKRWPPDRFAALGRHLVERDGLTVLVNGSPGERDLCDSIADAIGGPAASLAGTGITLGSLKEVVRRSRIMVTNDTGPRHIAAAFGVPVVTLFGLTDHRWTTIPAPAGEEILLADPTLPESEVADDHPDRCRVDRITTELVTEAVERLLAGRPARPS